MRFTVLANKLMSLGGKNKEFVVSQKTSMDFSLIFLANLINNATNFASNIIIARVFQQEVFGLFSIAANIAMTTVTFSEFGMNLTMVRLYKLYEKDSVKSKAVIIGNLWFKSGIFILLLCVGLFFGRPLSLLLTKRTDQTLLITAALLTGGVLGFWSYFKAFFQAFNLFSKIAAMTFLYAVLRMGFLFGFAVYPSFLNAAALFLGIYLIPISLVVLWSFYSHRDKFHLSGMSRNDVWGMSGEIITYSKWVALSMVAFTLLQRSTVFIAAAYLDLGKVAILSAGLLFSGVFSLINDSVRQILFPKIAQLRFGEIAGYKKKVLKILPLYIICSIIVIALLSLLMYLCLGDTYIKSLPIFWITGGSTALTAGIGFYNILYHSIMKPIPDTIINTATLCFLLIVMFLIVRVYGIMGIAVSYAILQLSGEIVKAAVLSRYLKGLANE